MSSHFFSRIESLAKRAEEMANYARRHLAHAKKKRVMETAANTKGKF